MKLRAAYHIASATEFTSALDFFDVLGIQKVDLICTLLDHLANDTDDDLAYYRSNNEWLCAPGIPQGCPMITPFGMQKICDLL